MPKLRPFNDRVMYSTSDIEVLDLWLDSAAEDPDTGSRLHSWFSTGQHTLTDLTFRYVDEDTLDLVESLLPALRNAPALIHFRILTDGTGVSTPVLFSPYLSNVFQQRTEGDFFRSMRFKRALHLLPPIEELSLSCDGVLCWPSFDAMADFENFHDDDDDDEEGRETDALERAAIESAITSLIEDVDNSDSDDSDDGNQKPYPYNEDHVYPLRHHSWRRMERAYTAWIAPRSVRYVHLEHVWNDQANIPDDPPSGKELGRGVSFERSGVPYIWNAAWCGRSEAPFLERDHFGCEVDFPVGPHIISYDSI